MTETSTVRPRARGRTLAERAALFDIPVSTAVSPDAEAARRHTIRWLRRYGVFDKAAAAEYDALRLDRLSALFYPRARGAALDLANDLNGWFFVFDDQFDGELGCCPDAVSRLVDSVVRVTGEPPGRGPDGGANPLVASFRDLWRRINSGVSQGWRDRFRSHWLGYLLAHKREARDRRAQSPRSLRSLLAVKRHSVGVQPCLDLHERFAGCTLPPALHAGWPLAEMRQATDDVVIFINDIVSLDKELAAGDVHNSVILLHERDGGPLEESVRRVADLANARYHRFQHLSERLPATLAASGASARLLRHTAAYTDGMRQLMSGSLAWSLETSRYDERGVAAVGGGRQRPWSDLTGHQATHRR
ncbi:pentalenene synthase [Streptomyces sp. LX-29]|uniref:isoafricanol synthase n=1 Tax=Streptomyces sp. LX-29 TaxID=2900152 RepID=UPI00240D123C|nr:isoafricanol synthase [Streptomyces sp. LX-29]WFB06342.1 pentalenene synthase [Streptomyces sp. LX-29]